MFSKGESENKKFYCVMQGDTSFLFEMKKPQKALPEQERLTLIRNFVKKMALSGELNEILSSEQLFQAKKCGYLPKKFNVHHYLPLSMGGGHQDENLCVIDKKLHAWIHAYLLDPIYRDSRFDFSEGKKVYLMLPAKKKVFTQDDFSLFFTSEELEQIQEDERLGKVPEYMPPQINNRDKISMLRFVEQLKRDMDMFNEEDRRKNEAIIDAIGREIREINTSYRRTGKQISKYWNDRREGKTRMPEGRREKAVKSAKKAKRAATRRFYPHLVARRFSNDGNQRDS